MRHFISEGVPVLLEESLFKAVPSRPKVYEFPPTEVKGLRPTKANVDKHLWKMAQKYGLEDIYPALVGTAKTESGRTQWRRGKPLTSETGAQGIMQLMPKTAEGLGVERGDWRGNIEGGVKLWSINYGKAKKAGMSRSDATDYAAMSYFSGGAGGKDPSKNTSAVEAHNQKALGNLRKKYPDANLWDVSHKKLKGAPSMVSKFGGVKDWRKKMTSEVAGGGGVDPSGKRTFTGALDKYAKGVKRRSEADTHYVRVGKDRPQAERHGLQGYVKRDPATGEGVASVPIQQSRVREAPQYAVAERSLPAQPVARPPASGSGTTRVVSPDVGKFGKSIKFKSELFIEA